MINLVKVLISYARCQRGNIAITTALAMPALLGFGGLAVDASLWLRAKSSVQGAADASAYSVAAAVGSADPNTPTPQSRWQVEGYAAAAANGYVNGQNGVVVNINNPPTSGAYAGHPSAYEAIVQKPQRLYLAKYFATMFGLQPPTVSGRAVSQVTVHIIPATTMATPTCILALNQVLPPPSNGTMAVNGGATVTANNCDVDDDSTSAKSINSSGGGTLKATNVYTRGGIDGSVRITATEAVTTYGSYVVPDPYASYGGKPAPRSIPAIPIFQPSSANGWGQNGHTVNIANPTGVIAYQGDVTVKGTVNLAPGVYIIADGNFNSTGALNGTGVTIVLTTTGVKTNGAFGFSGGAQMTLTAPTTGTTAGIVLWADKKLALDTSDNFVGGSTNGIVGAIYLPSHLAKYAGNQAAVTRCMQLIADQITFTGTPTFNHDCAGVSILDPVIVLKPSSSSSSWSLVE